MIEVIEVIDPGDGRLDGAVAPTPRWGDSMQTDVICARNVLMFAAGLTLALGQWVAPAFADGDSGGGTAHYDDRTLTGSDLASAARFDVYFGPCVDGKRTVELRPGGSIRGEEIIRVLSPHVQTEDCTKGFVSKSWQAVLRTTRTGTSPVTGTTSTTPTYWKVNVVVNYYENGDKQDPDLLGSGGDGMTLGATATNLVEVVPVERVSIVTIPTPAGPIPVPVVSEEYNDVEPVAAPPIEINADEEGTSVTFTPSKTVKPRK